MFLLSSTRKQFNSFVDEIFLESSTSTLIDHTTIPAFVIVNENSFRLIAGPSNYDQEKNNWNTSISIDGDLEILYF